MNFDIKYATYLQTFDFIKIEQVLGTILGTQSWGSKARATDHFGYTLGIANESTDRVGPISQRQREKKKEKKRNAAGLRKTDKGDPQFNDLGSCTPCANKINLRIALSLKHSASDPFVLNAPGSSAP